MSRAFVKESDDDLELPDRPISEHPNDVTAEGFALIEAALAGSRQALALAQASSDRGAVAQASRDLRYWTARRSTAQIVPASEDRNLVRFGATVRIRRDDGREQTFRIVGEDEADPAQGTVSHVSPLARAMFGRQSGEMIRVGLGDAEILHIS